MVEYLADRDTPRALADVDELWKIMVEKSGISV